jgi:hypothetical protein
MKQFCDPWICKKPLDVFRPRLAGADLNDIGGPVAPRQLDDAEPVPMRNQPQGLGVDRDAIAKIGIVRQIALVEADGHRPAPIFAEDEIFEHQAGRERSIGRAYHSRRNLASAAGLRARRLRGCVRCTSTSRCAASRRSLLGCVRLLGWPVPWKGAKRESLAANRELFSIGIMHLKSPFESRL